MADLENSMVEPSGSSDLEANMPASKTLVFREGDEDARRIGKTNA